MLTTKRVGLLAALVIFAFTYPAMASDITYNVDQTIGAGSVTGSIETDGTIGTLGVADILNWNLLLNDGTNTFDLLGPLSGSNSGVEVGGTDLTANATELLFNFGASEGGLFDFQAPAPASGEDGWCGADQLSNCPPLGGEGVLVSSFADEQTELLDTDVVIATVATSAVPEPSSLLLLGIGLLSLGVMTFWLKNSAESAAV
jgi:hypothetical protein